MFEPVFSPEIWARVPFHFWSLVFFVFGSMVGSFLNVCIHRMPLGLSVVSPPSHCPHCKYSIPWYLNMPLFTWLFLRGKCKNCRAPISVRYFLVELLTAALFLGCWLVYGKTSAWLALTYALLLAGMVAATFIDFEHYIIPDEITIGGTVVGVLLSLCPQLHGQPTIWKGLWQGLLGAGVGWLLIYAIVRLGKLMFGRQRVQLRGCEDHFLRDGGSSARQGHSLRGIVLSRVRRNRHPRQNDRAGGSRLREHHRAAFTETALDRRRRTEP